MKIKLTRICTHKGCNKEFKLYKSTDKYCSPGCAYASQKSRPNKKLSPIKPMSEKRKRESYAYTKKRKIFLSLAANRFCPVCVAVFDGVIDREEIEGANTIFFYQGIIETIEIHHKAGRIGRLLNYVPFWLAVSSCGHDWIHAYPEKAYKLGFLIKSTTVKI